MHQVRLTISVLAMMVCSSGGAQQLYKCGSTFQDRPCDAEVQKKYSAITGSFTKEQVTTTADAQCAELGGLSVPVIQARSANESLESLHQKIDSKPIGRQEKIREKELVTSVFSKKGSASEIRGGIETDCMEKKQASRKLAPGYASTDTSYSSRNVAAARSAAADAARAAAMAARQYNR